MLCYLDKASWSYECENCEFVVPFNVLNPFVHAPFFWAARHTTVYLDIVLVQYLVIMLKTKFNECLHLLFTSVLVF